MTEVRRFDSLEKTVSETSKKVDEKNALLLNRLSTHAHDEPFRTQSPDALTSAWRSHIGTDAYDRFSMDSDGFMRWGDGTAPPTGRLYAVGSGLRVGTALETSGTLTATGGLSVPSPINSGGSGSLLFRIDSDPSSTGWRFFWNGTNVQFVRRDTNAVVKTFVIDHPMKNDRYLVHATTESPHNGVEYWGTVTLHRGQAEVVLPDYFESLTSTENRQVQLTAVADMSATGPVPALAATEIKDGKFQIVSDQDGDVKANWLVKAVRKDVAPLDPEPRKADVTKLGQGPYTYLIPRLP